MGYCMQAEVVLLWGYRFPVLVCVFAQILIAPLDYLLCIVQC